MIIKDGFYSMICGWNKHIFNNLIESWEHHYAKHKPRYKVMHFIILSTLLFELTSIPMTSDVQSNILHYYSHSR